MRFICFFFITFSSNIYAGPYLEFETDYDPDPAYEYQSSEINGEYVETSRVEASNYIGIASIGWEWDARGIIDDEDILTVRLKAFEHRSDILNSGDADVVSKDEIRGVSVKYRFW